MKKILLIVSLGSALSLAGFQTANGAEEAGDESIYIEEIVVQGERGDVNVMDRPMTVTGFNAGMIERLGLDNMADLEVLVPGLQIGNRSQGGEKMEDDHFYMRGIGSERSVNFFSDTSVAVYIDGVWTDQTYGIDSLFDLERIEVARGPQGTTGGRAAMAGSINFHTRKPTDSFDIRTSVEFTDQSTQRFRLAFGGPISDSGFSYRLRLSSYTGDGNIENIGYGPDGGEPDQTIIAPSLRWKNDRWDITVRYSKQEDTGTPTSSLPLGAVNSTDEFILDGDGNCLLITDPDSPAGDPQQICQRNPYYGTQQAPSVANCSNIHADGTRDEMNIICDPEDLQWKVAFNAPSMMDNFAENASIDAIFALNDQLTVNYKFGWHDVRQKTINDTDQRNRVGGGVCPAEHPKVALPVTDAWTQDSDGNWLPPGTPIPGATAMLTEGQTSRYCALDGAGDGTFADTRLHSVFTSTQTSHEISLASDYDGPFNFTLGYTRLEGEEPNYYSGPNHGSSGAPWFYEDNSAACEAAIESLFSGQLLRDMNSDATTTTFAATGGYMKGCPGSPEFMNYSDTGDTTFPANLDGFYWAFYGSAEYESTGAYFNGQYEFDDSWTFFGGVRHDEDKKDRTQSAYAYSTAMQADGTLCNDGNFDDCFVVLNLSMHGSRNPGYAPRGDLEWSKTTWNVGTEYRPNADVMVYTRISAGYRAGGSMGYGVSQAPWQFDSEEMTNYEVGVKGLYFNGSLQLQATYFFQDFDNYWVNAARLRTEAEMAMSPNSSPLTGDVEAISGTEIQGIELEGAWRISDRLTLRGFYNYLDTSVGDFQSLYEYAIPGKTGGDWVAIPWTDANGTAQTAWIQGDADGNANIVDYTGNQLVNQPKHKTSLTLTYEAPIPAYLGTLDVLTIVNYRSKKYVELGNMEAYAVDAYTRWDIRANWRSPDSKWAVTAYVQNLLDEAALNMWSPREGTASPWGSIVEQRRIGLTVSWQN